MVFKIDDVMSNVRRPPLRTSDPAGPAGITDLLAGWDVGTYIQYFLSMCPRNG